ncbi:MAG: conjugal transfer protein TraF [Thiotrichales bacterium]|nr:conjugal transfer protein TraF [Thiotrichales bacterium]
MNPAAVLLGATLLLAAGADAREWRAWCGDGLALGWHFYCDAAEEETPAKTPEPPAEPEPRAEAPPDAATARVAALRQALAEARARAVLEPSQAHVTAYLHLQQAALDRAATFSDAVRRTVWATPALDYTLRRPVGALGKHLWADARRAERAQVLAQLGDRYGLIYLGDGACPACRVFGPLVRAFATRHGLDVLAVSRDGGPLDGWPDAVADHGRSAALGLADVPLPALVLYDTQTRRVQPVAFGVVAEDQLAERLFVLTARAVGHDY